MTHTNAPAESYDAADIERRCLALWETSKIYSYDPHAKGVLFSVDTPPPYVSAAHLHVGHAMSYAQAEFIVRYRRMKGDRIYYPMGFDDNGLPTERYVEKAHNIDTKTIGRAEFRALCLDETKKGIVAYRKLWRALGLSCDWSQSYSTIDARCRTTAQKSFIELYQQGRIYRSDEPVLWDTHFETALAQADLETRKQRGQLHEIVFEAHDGTALCISTTRPEMLPACVALYCHPNDARYQHMVGHHAHVPLFGHKVPILTDSDVKLDFGTGLMMVCTWGDGEDIKKWKRDSLETRLILESNGLLNERAGPYAGKAVKAARKAIVRDLKLAELHRGARNVDQHVSVSERSDVPVEINTAPQWFIRVLDLKETLLERSAQINWRPEWMKVRLDDWINGLKYDWNISRQRFYGVPFPLWFCRGCGQTVLADTDSLPVDPLEDPCPIQNCTTCGGDTFDGEPDVMDTWMTSSMTPLINSNWAQSEGHAHNEELYPMGVRVQAFEIIRSWLFYTVVKSHLHTNTLPWNNVMISGWGLNEQGQKISKRDLHRTTDASSGYNRYEPYAVIQKYGADALRYWAAGSHLGQDSRYTEKSVRAGRKVAIKLWNAARFAQMQCEGWDPTAPRIPFAERTLEDRWLLTELNQLLPTVERGFESYDYAIAREALDRFFWGTLTDNYLEMIKARFWEPETYPEHTRESARATLWEALRTTIALYAPFIPFVTEELYQRLYQATEGTVSLHITAWPTFDEARTTPLPEMASVFAILGAVRTLRTANKLSQNKRLQAVVIDVDDTDTAAQLRTLEPTIRAVSRAGEIRWEHAEQDCDLASVRVGIVFD